MGLSHGKRQPVGRRRAKKGEVEESLRPNLQSDREGR